VRGETAGRTCSLFSVPRHFYEYEIRGRGGERGSVAYLRGARCPLRSIIADTPAILALHKATRELCRSSVSRDAKADAHTRATRKGHRIKSQALRRYRPRNYFTANRQRDSAITPSFTVRYRKEMFDIYSTKWLDMHNRTRVIVIATAIFLAD